MKSPLNILHLEDDPLDALLVQSALEQAEIECTTTRVESQAEFVAFLERGDVDLVLSDYLLPTFDGMAAAQLVQARWPSIPLILVSGTLGEEFAVESLKNGATDYVLKERLFRLGPAVRRAMREVEVRAERTHLEASLIEAQKMEVLGQLAGGVAHDFNNLLSVIMGYNDLLTSELAADSPLREHTREIRHASERAVGLTRQLLIFSRQQTVQPALLCINDVLQDVDQILHRLIETNIGMTIVAAPDLGLVKTDSGYLGQVLMNLVVNARDAMPEGGRMTITTSNCDRGEPNAGEYVALSVSDTGAGMTDEVKAHVFEAFYTTKPQGKGTGLGLHICQSIVAQSGGDIAIDSELGRGTTVTVHLPRVHGVPEGAATAVPGQQPGAGGTETLLLVEDEPSLRILACQVLAAQGYAVLGACNGQEALKVVRDHQGPPIRLVITDVMMPLMGGVVMVEWLQVTHPGLRVLFTSGYSEDGVGYLEQGVEFLAKPYNCATLVGRVRALLDAELPL